MSRSEAEDFLYEEARLLDDGQLEDWLALFAEDGVYWLPIDSDAGPLDHLSLIYDDAHRLKERVYRLTQTVFPSQNPPSRTRHLVTNVRVGEVAGDEVIVYSSQLIMEIRAGAADDRQMDLGEQRSFAAGCEHRLRADGDGWKITLKRMVLLNRDLAIPNLTFLL